MLIYKKAAEYGHPLALALVSSVVSRKAASAVLLPFRNPNCSGPNMAFSSAMAVMSLGMLDGTVRGLYWEG